MSPTSNSLTFQTKSSRSSARRLTGRAGQQQTGPEQRSGPSMAAITSAGSPHSVLGTINMGRIGAIILLLAIIQSNDRSSIVRCQDFEDLNNNKPAGNSGGGNSQFLPQQQPQNAAPFQPSRQFAQSSSSNNPQFQVASNSRQPFQRPNLSNRFAQQQLSSQASTISNTVVASQQQQQQQTLPTTTGQQQSTAQTVAAPSNIEQIMKNALARTTRLEQSVGNVAESRQDQNSEQIQSRSGSQFQSSPSQATGQSSSSSTSARERNAEAASEAQASTTQSGDESDKQTTQAALGTINGHDTVYSDQRFANLFARRNNQKKTKFTPTEQIKAKPTLPSFIKSPPDPKQFNVNSAEGQDRPITQASANLISVRLQQLQSNQNRQIVNQDRSQSQKKPAVITSNTAASANNKRLNSQKQLAPATSPKASSASRGTGSQATANVTNKPISNNPFNKSQQSSSDPANVIAMARRRLLANNAVQQQRPAAN